MRERKRKRVKESSLMGSERASEKEGERGWTAWSPWSPWSHGSLCHSHFFSPALSLARSVTLPLSLSPSVSLSLFLGGRRGRRKRREKVRVRVKGGNEPEIQTDSQTDRRQANRQTEGQRDRHRPCVIIMSVHPCHSLTRSFISQEQIIHTRCSRTGPMGTRRLITYTLTRQHLEERGIENKYKSCTNLTWLVLSAPPSSPPGLDTLCLATI